MPEREESKDSDLVFNDLLTLGRTNELLPKWAKLAKIDKHLTFHISRHTFAVQALTKDINIYTVSKLLGHQSVKTTEIYADILDETKQKAMAAMGEIKI